MTYPSIPTKPIFAYCGDCRWSYTPKYQYSADEIVYTKSQWPSWQLKKKNMAVVLFPMNRGGHGNSPPQHQEKHGKSPPKYVVFLRRWRGEAWVFRVHSPRRSRGECTRDIQCLSDLSVREWHSFQFWNVKKPKNESSSTADKQEGIMVIITFCCTVSWFIPTPHLAEKESFLLPT